MSLHNWILISGFCFHGNGSNHAPNHTNPFHARLQTLYSVGKHISGFDCRSTEHKGKTNTLFKDNFTFNDSVEIIKEGVLVNYMPDRKSWGTSLMVFHSKAGSLILIKAGDRWPPGRLLARPFFYLTWLRGTEHLPWPTEAEGNLCFKHGSSSWQQRGPLCVFSSDTCFMRTGTPVSPCG